MISSIFSAVRTSLTPCCRRQRFADRPRVIRASPPIDFCSKDSCRARKKIWKRGLALLDKERATAIIYESPHRLSATLDVFAKRWPERECAAVREITKRFEETVRGTTVSVRDHFNANVPRGEFVLILGGAVETETSAEDTLAQGLALAKQSSRKAPAPTRPPKKPLRRQGFPNAPSIRRCSPTNDP